MGDTWTPPASDKVSQPAWTPPSSDRVASDIPLTGRVSPDMNDHDILVNGLGYSEDKAKEIMSAPGYKSGMFKGAVTDPNGFVATIGHTVLGSIYKGAMADPSGALGQIASHVGTALGLNDARNTELRDAMMKLGRANYQQNWKGNTGYNAATGQGSKTSATDLIGQGIGQVLPFLATEGKSPSAIAGKVLSREALPALGKLAAQGTVMGELQPATGDGSFLGQKAEQGALGATGGLVGGVVGQKVLAPLTSKVVNAFQGRLAPEAEASLARLQQAGVQNPSIADITGSPSAKFLETSTGRVPFSGVQSAGATRLDQLSSGTMGTLQDIRNQLTNTPWSDLGSVQKAAASGNKQAQGVLNLVQNAGDDWNTILQAGGKLKSFQTKLTKDALYDNVAKAAGDANVPLPSVHTALQSATDEINRTIPNPQLQKLVGDIQDRYFPGRNESGQMVAAPSDTSFTGLQLLRSRLGNMIAGGTPEEQAVLKPVKAALDADMNAFASKSGNSGLKDAWKQADSYYRNTYLPTKSGAFAKAFNGMDPGSDVTADKIFDTLFKPGTTPMEAQRIFTQLDPKAQSAVRTGIVSRAVDAATQEEGKFSPAKYQQFISKYSDTAGVAFKGQDAWAVDGLAKVMGQMKNTAALGANPINGSLNLTSMATYGVPGVAMGLHGGISPAGIGAAAATVATEAAGARFTKFMLTSPVGRNLLLAAKDLPADSPALAKIVQKALTLSSQYAGASVGAGTATPLKPAVAIP